MASKVIDVDELLGENALELKVRGEIFKISDISMESFLRISKVTQEEIVQDPETSASVVHQQLAMFLDVDVEKVSHLGMKAVTIMINKIRDWLLSDVEGFDAEAKKATGVQAENP